MEELTKKIKRDLFDIKENINSPDKIMELFSFSREEFEGIIHNLKFSVEDSLFEYKTTAVNLILEPLKSLQFDSRAMNSYSDQIEKARGLLAVTLIQRLIAVRTIKIVEHKSDSSPEITEEQIEQPGIKEILAYVQKELNANPESQKDPQIKKIFMHVKMYQNETQKMNELTAKVSADKKIAIKRNFDTTLGEQVSKMREAYNEMINKTIKQDQAPVQQNILLRYDYKSMSRFYQIQIEAFSKMLSTLMFADHEKFQTRELLLTLTEDQQNLRNMIIKEKAEYSNIAPFDKSGSETGKAFVKRISEYLEREKEWLKIHPGKQ